MKTIQNDNTYRCHIYHMINGTLHKNANDACFAGIKSYLDVIDWQKKIDNPSQEIYIYDFEREETIKYVPILVKIINRITPCEIVEINDKKYIKFKLISNKYYDQNLVILNFIRNLWNEPSRFYVKNELKTYYQCFFQALAKSRYKDPLERLTQANILALTETKYSESAGHSNTFNFKQGKRKTVKELIEYEGNNTKEFLTK